MSKKLENKDILLDLIEQMLIRPAKYHVKSKFKQGKRLYQSSELIYNPGLTGTFTVYNYDQPVLEFKTFDYYAKKEANEKFTLRHLHHFTCVWINPTSNVTNWRYFATHTSKRGFIADNEYTKKVNDVIRYTNAVIEISDKDLEKLNQYLAKKSNY